MKYCMANTILLGITIILITGLIIIKNRIRIIRFIKKHQIIRFMVNVVIPFVVPFVLSILFSIESIKASKIGFASLLSIIILICVALLNLIIQCAFWIKEQKECDIRWVNQAAKHAYSNLFKIHMDKNSQLRNAHHHGLERGMLTDADIPYNIFDHIRKITWEFCDTISKITDIPIKDLEAGFIYHYDYPGAGDGDRRWRWITGKGSKFNHPLNDYVAQTDSTFHYMINNNVSTLFFNDKYKGFKKQRYHFSYRDHSHDCIGSFVAAKVAFSGNDSKLCEGIIMITSHGKRFLDALPKYTEKELAHLILDDIFPNYRNLLTTELAMLYFRHQDEENMVCGEKCCKRCKKTDFSKFRRYKRVFKCFVEANKKVWIRK